MPLTPRRAAAVLAAVTSAVAVPVALRFPAAQAGVVAFCDGKPATIVGTEEVDVLYGTDAVDVIAALGGDDRIHDLGQGDTACGDLGDDVLSSRTAGASSFGGEGDDLLFGSEADDTVISGGEGNDELLGQGGEDTMRGDTGEDRFISDEGDDTMYGGADADTFVADDGADLLYGGSGRDVVTYEYRTFGVYVDLRERGAVNGNEEDGRAGHRDTIRQAEDIVGGSGGDHLFGNGKANEITGRGDNDRIYGRGGNDRISTIDKRRDRTYCGTGFDRAFADTRDRVRGACERAYIASDNEQP